MNDDAEPRDGAADVVARVGGEHRRHTSVGIAVVVGATGAIGSVIVRRLLGDGRRVLAVARDRDALDRLAAGDDRVVTCATDVTAPGSGDAVRAALPDGPVGMVVYAASAPLGAGILETEPEVVDAAIDVKVNGLLRLVRALHDRLGEDSRIVAIGGNLGFDPVPTASTAGIANAAQANLMRQLNRALAPDGVTCHVVAPGPVLTPRYHGLAVEEARQRGVDVDQVLAEAAVASPLGRLTTAEDVAWAVARLGDPEAAALAGSTLLLDAGRRTAIP